MDTYNNRLEGEIPRRPIPVGDWRFRFDQPPTPSDLIDAFDGDLFRLLHLGSAVKLPTLGEFASKTDPSKDRRESERHLPASSNAMIGWWRGAEFVVFHASIANLGPGGMLIQLVEHPTQAQPVWLCLGEPKLDSLAQARVLDILRTPKGTYQVRLAFHTPCPLAFLEAAGRRER